MMKKNTLLLCITLLCTLFLFTGCVQGDVFITFDNKDNMQVETSILFRQEAIDYLGGGEIPDDLTEDIQTKIEGLDIHTDIQKIDNKDFVGTKKIERCKRISKAKNIAQLSIIRQQNNQSILNTKNYLFLKKYFFKGKIEELEKQQKSKNTIQTPDPNDFFSTKIRIKVPTFSKFVKANTSVIDINDPNIYVWKVDYNNDNPIEIEFCTFNWYVIAGTVIILLLMLVYLLKPTKWNINFTSKFKSLQKTELSNSKQNFPINSEKQKIVQNNQNSQKAVKIVVTLLIVLVLVAIALIFALPKICSILVDNSIKSVYVGETVTATKMIEFANILNMDKNVDLSTKVFAKGLEEVDNNDSKTAKAFFDLVLKTKTEKEDEYATQLTNKAMKVFNEGKFSKCKIIMELAKKFNAEIPKTKSKELGKKASELCLDKKYEEALVIYETLLLLDSQKAENHGAYGATLALSGKYKEAVAAYTEALNLKKDFGLAYLNRGLLYKIELSDDDKALKDFEQAINILYGKKELGLAKLNMSEIYAKRKNYLQVMTHACDAEKIFLGLGDYSRRARSANLCNMAICKLGGYCGPLIGY